MRRAACLTILIAAVFILTACGVVLDNGNLKIKDKGTDIISIGSSGFKLNGNLTGISLDGNGLNIEYPNGSLVWDSGGFNIKNGDGSIRIVDGSMVITDKDGKTKTLDTNNDGAEYKADSGAIVRTGKKAVMPTDYPADMVPLMDGFVLNATAELGSVEVVSGYVKNKTLDDAIAYYQPILIKGSSYSQDKKADSAVIRAKLDNVDVTVYLFKSLTADAINMSVVIGK
jgi:hypothetical protein